MKKIIAMLLAVLCLTSVFAVPSYAEGRRATYNKVDTPILTFKENNALKIWSVCKAMGMTDNQAAGVIGVFERESGLDPSALEGVFETGMTDKKKKLMKDKKALTDYCVNSLFARYDAQGLKINKSAYKGVDGNYYPAVGLPQFTGGRFSKLLLYSEYHKVAWYEIDNQLAYFFKESDKSGYSDGHGKWIVEKYIANTKASVDECTAEWLRVFEGVPGNHLAQRQANARSWLRKFKGSKGDINYAKKIMKLMDKPYMGSGGNTSTDIADVSIYHELASKVLIMSQNSGFRFDFDGTKTEKQNKANSEVLAEMVGKDKSKNKYSLYDLFGSDIHYYRYLGESTTSLTLLDHAFTYLLEGRISDLGLGESIFYDSEGRYLSAHVYSGRPLVLNSDILLQGSVDPRVSSIVSYFSGYSYTHSELMLTFCKLVTDATTYMLGPEPLEHVGSFVDSVLSIQLLKDIRPMILVLLGFAMVGFILSLLKHTVGIYKGQEALKHVIVRALVGILLLGGVFAFIASPTALNKQIVKVATITDSIFAETLSKAYEDDEVIGSTDSSNVTAAAIWKTAIFEPWCQAVFGDKYENLYTQYSDKPEENKMKQSYLTEEGITNIKAGQYGYNSAKYTGDVYVPVGNGVQIRNWAAYLYSCQSRFHKDYDVANIQLQEDKKDDKEKNYLFPFAKTTARNANINADTFRVIDAQMDISPQVYSDGKEIFNYTGAKRLEHHYIKYTAVMMWNVLMLLFFWPLIFKKLSSLMKLLFFGVQFVYYTIQELFKESGKVAEMFGNVKENALQYLLACIKIYIMTIMYTLLVGKGMIFAVLFIFIAFNILATTPSRVVNGVNQLKHKAVRYKNELVK